MLKDKLNISTIDIDLYRNHIYNKEKIKSLDVNSRFKRFKFFYNGLLLNLETITVRAYMVKSDNKEIFNDLTIIDGNIAELEFTNQALLIPGILKLELVLYEDDAELSSFLLEYEVIKSLRSDNSIESSNEYTSLQIALHKVELWNKNYQALYDKWNTDFDNLHTNKSDLLDNLKTTKENELNKLKLDKDNELTTLYNSKDEELTTLKNTWDEEFKKKYDGLNQEYSSRVTILEDDILNTNSSEPLLNENTTFFKVGTGTVNGVAKDYTDHMEQSLVTLDNIEGYTPPRSSNSQLPGIRLNEIGIFIDNENDRVAQLPKTSNDYKQGTVAGWDMPWSTNQSTPSNDRIRINNPIKVPQGSKYMYVVCNNVDYEFSIIGCKKGATDDTSSDRNLDDLGWVGEDGYLGRVYEIPEHWNSIGVAVKKRKGGNLNPNSDGPHIRGIFHFFKDISRIYSEQLLACSLPNGNIKDKLINGKLYKRVMRFTTADGNWKTTEFSTVTSGSTTYGRIVIEVPNLFVSSADHIDCGNVEALDYNSGGKSEWEKPTRNTLIFNAQVNKYRIAFTLSGRTTQSAAEAALLIDNPRIITALMQSSEVIDLNMCIKANPNDIIMICSPLTLTCTHTVQLNNKSQIEKLQKLVQLEKKSVWQKLKLGLDIKFALQENGYIKFPSAMGGFTIQWGVAKNVPSQESPTSVLFPISFNKVFSGVATMSGGSYSDRLGVTSIFFDNKVELIHKQGTSRPISWIAIGRQ